MYFHNFLRIFVPILILAGCGKKRPVKLQFIEQARLVDIPVAPGVNPINLNHKDLNNNYSNKKPLTPSVLRSLGEVESIEGVEERDIRNKSNNYSNQVVSLKYRTNLSYDQIKKFYLEQMELCDWQLAWSAPAHQQASFIFQKPNRVCVIFIENLEEKCEVRLSSGPR